MAQGFFGVPTAEQEREALRQQSQQLQQSLDAINRRLEDLEKEKAR
jgi:predicted nuclease with TOPRIM domain